MTEMSYVRVFRRTDKSIVFETSDRSLYDDFVGWIVPQADFEEIANDELYPAKIEAGIKIKSADQNFFFVLVKEAR
jgi:hypothetical protein